MKLKEIRRTATFAWSPASGSPVLATGTMSGALDASFSNDSQLELWEPDFADEGQFDLGGENQAKPIASLVTSAKYVSPKF
jgi:protein transport protein SEC31